MKQDEMLSPLTLVLEIPVMDCTEQRVSDLKRTLASSPGSSRVVLCLRSPRRRRFLLLTERYGVEVGPELWNALVEAGVDRVYFGTSEGS